MNHLNIAHGSNTFIGLNLVHNPEYHRTITRHVRRAETHTPPSTTLLLLHVRFAAEEMTSPDDENCTMQFQGFLFEF